MALVSASNPPRVLLLCEDPVESHLLRSLLRSLPDQLRPEIVSADPAQTALPPEVSDCAFCFAGFGYGGKPLEQTLASVRLSSPGARCFGLLSSARPVGDRTELLRVLRSGVEDVLLLEELSLKSLAALLGPQTGAGAQTRPALATPQYTPTESALATGAWRIALAEQHAGFDEPTLRGLGYAPGETGSGIGDWKQLIHPDDIDRLVAEVHRVLNGSAPPHPVSYRVRRHDGSWLPVVSDDISVELDDAGAPRSIGGSFYHEQSRIAAPSEEPQPAPVAQAAAQVAYTPGGELFSLSGQCDTAISVFRLEADGVFRLSHCNLAAARIEDRDPATMPGSRPDEIMPHCDDFNLAEALQRVHASGIPETREVMLPTRSDSAQWRRYRIHLLEDAQVMTEVSDISESVGARIARRTQEEMANFIARSFPLTSLLLDERGRVIQCISVAGSVFGDQPSQIEDRTVFDLLGSEAGTRCQSQIVHTLNTGRLNSEFYDIDAGSAKRTLECFSAPLRGRPGMPQRVLLCLLDVSVRNRELSEARAVREQLRDALHRIPVPLYLKDLDGRYLAINPPFETLLGIEEAMLLGKTDVEVFPDELAMNLHEADRRVLESGSSYGEYHVAGHGEHRGEHHCFYFPVFDGEGAVSGTAGLWIAPGSLPKPAAIAQGADVQPLIERRAQRQIEIEEATASVIGRVEDVLTDAGDYADVLKQLEQLVETTMHAQALIHQVAGHDQQPPRLLVALAPLAEDIVELERILLPDSARFENELEENLPAAQCDPVVFHQILLRGIRHARRALDPQGTLGIRLRSSASGKRACVSCREGFEGNYVELVIEDSASRLDTADIEHLTAAPDGVRVAGGALDDLAEIHALAHTQGGHLQIHQNVPTGISVHVFFRTADPTAEDGNPAKARSSVARFPLGRTWHNKNPSN